MYIKESRITEDIHSAIKYFGAHLNLNSKHLSTDKEMGLLKKIISTALLFLVAWEVVKAAPAADQDHCSVRFQKAFQEVIQLKKTCGAIHYKDCCQV